MVDVEKIIVDEHNATLACAKIARLIQEGLNDSVTLPEVRSEAAIAAHILLGCDIWMALYVQMCGLHNIKANNELPEEVDRIVSVNITDQVVKYAALVVMHRGPLGETECGIEDD